MFAKRNLTELFVFFIILVFILLKIPALHLPYFWDELGVYSRAGLYLHDNGIGLLPKDLPPELSRGHPLLFAFIQAIGYSIFGEDVIGGHITALIISVILLWSVYFITAKHYSKYTGLLAVMLLMVQPLFFAQSVLILPEICLALFIIWAIYFWVGKKFILHGIFSTLAILIKETAIIIPLVIIFSEMVYYLINRGNNKKIHFQFKYLMVLLPFLVFGLFLLMQKQQNGWYLFPLHGENVKISLNRIFDFGGDYLLFLFFEQGRIVISIILVISIIYLVTSKRLIKNKTSIFLGILILGGISFNAINFYMNRYILFVLIPFVILSSAVLIQCFRINRFVIFGLPLIFVAGIYCLTGKEIVPVETSELNIQQRFQYDENMSYVEYLKIQQKAMNILLDSISSGEIIYTNFPISIALMDSRYGFTDLVMGKDFRVLSGDIGSKDFNYAIISNPGSYDYYLPDSTAIKLIQQIENEVVTINIYEHK